MTKNSKLVLDYWAGIAVLTPENKEDNNLWYKLYQARLRAERGLALPEDWIDDLDSLWDSCENGDGDFQRFEDAVVAFFG